MRIWLALPVWAVVLSQPLTAGPRGPSAILSTGLTRRAVALPIPLAALFGTPFARSQRVVASTDGRTIYATVVPSLQSSADGRVPTLLRLAGRPDETLFVSQ